MDEGRTAIIVAGRPRSGTSETMRIANLLGAELAFDLAPASIDDEREYRESKSSIAPRFVLPFRHPEAVAASLESRERGDLRARVDDMSRQHNADRADRQQERAR